MKDDKRVSVSILDKEYQVACPPSEHDMLRQAANELDQRMRTARRSGSVIGTDRIAIMVALNLCHELQGHMREAPQDATAEWSERITHKLDQALKPKPSK